MQINQNPLDKMHKSGGFILYSLTVDKGRGFWYTNIRKLKEVITMLYQDSFYSIFIYDGYGKITTPYGTTIHSLAVCYYVLKKFRQKDFSIVQFL